MIQSAAVQRIEIAQIKLEVVISYAWKEESNLKMSIRPLYVISSFIWLYWILLFWLPFSAFLWICRLLFLPLAYLFGSSYMELQDPLRIFEAQRPYTITQIKPYFPSSLYHSFTKGSEGPNAKSR